MQKIQEHILDLENIFVAIGSVLKLGSDNKNLDEV